MKKVTATSRAIQVAGVGRLSGTVGFLVLPNDVRTGESAFHSAFGETFCNTNFHRYQMKLGIHNRLRWELACQRAFRASTARWQASSHNKQGRVSGVVVGQATLNSTRSGTRVINTLPARIDTRALAWRRTAS